MGVFDHIVPTQGIGNISFGVGFFTMPVYMLALNLIISTIANLFYTFFDLLAGQINTINNATICIFRPPIHVR